MHIKCNQHCSSISSGAGVKGENVCVDYINNFPDSVALLFNIAVQPVETKIFYWKKNSRICFCCRYFLFCGTITRTLFFAKKNRRDNIFVCPSIWKVVYLIDTNIFSHDATMFYAIINSRISFEIVEIVFFCRTVNNSFKIDFPVQ